MKTFNLNRPAIIMAFNMKGPQKDEAKRVKALTGLPFKALIGCWSGEIEYSYVFVPRSFEDMHKLFKLAREYKQDAVMYLDQYRNALVIPQDHYEMAYLMLRAGLGTHTIAKEMGANVLRWHQIEKESALKSMAYTLEPESDKYWVAS